MKDKIKEIRKSMEMTQEEFAARIGVTCDVVSAYETGCQVPSDSMIRTICREFNVNRSWLLDGEGEMFTDTKNNPLRELVRQYKLSDFDYILLEQFLQLSRENRAAVTQYIRQVAAILDDFHFDEIGKKD